jgi:hypothetical protein
MPWPPDRITPTPRPTTAASETRPERIEPCMTTSTGTCQGSTNVTTRSDGASFLLKSCTRASPRTTGRARTPATIEPTCGRNNRCGREGDRSASGWRWRLPFARRLPACPMCDGYLSVHLRRKPALPEGATGAASQACVCLSCRSCANSCRAASRSAGRGALPGRRQRGELVLHSQLRVPDEAREVPEFSHARSNESQSNPSCRTTA